MLTNFKVMINISAENQVKLDKLVAYWNSRTDFEHGEINVDVVMGDLLFKHFNITAALDSMLEACCDE